MSLSASSSQSSEPEPPGVDTPSPAALHNSALRLAFPIIFTYGVVGLTFPFWPLYFDSIGLTESQISLLIGIGPLVAIFTFQIWGYIADTVLNARIAMLIMSIVTAVVCAAFPYFQGFGALLLLMTLLTVFSAPRISMTSAVVLANHDGEKNYGVLRTLGTLAFVAVVMIVTPLTEPERFGEGIIFPILVVLNVLCAVSVLALKDRKPGSVAGERGERPSFMEVQRALFANPVMRAFLLFLMLSQIPHNISHHLVVLFVRDVLEGTNTQATMTVTIGGVAEIIIFLTFARIMANIRLMPLLFMAVAASVVRWGALYLYPTLFTVFLSSALHMFTYGLMHMCSVILVNREMPEKYRASGQSMLNLIYFGVTMAVGPALAAIFFKVGSLQAWFGFAAAMSAASLFVWIEMSRRYTARHQVSGLWVRPTLKDPIL